MIGAHDANVMELDPLLVNQLSVATVPGSKSLFINHYLSTHLKADRLQLLTALQQAGHIAVTDLLELAAAAPPPAAPATGPVEAPPSEHPIDERSIASRDLPTGNARNPWPTAPFHLRPPSPQRPKPQFLAVGQLPLDGKPQGPSPPPSSASSSSTWKALGGTPPPPKASNYVRTVTFGVRTSVLHSELVAARSLAAGWLGPCNCCSFETVCCTDGRAGGCWSSPSVAKWRPGKKAPWQEVVLESENVLAGARSRAACCSLWFRESC